MHSTRYTILYAAMTTIIAAIVLALAADGLKERQQRNIALEKKQNILQAVGVTNREGIEQLYKKHIQELVVNVNGEVVAGVDAFSIDIRKEAKKPKEKRLLPIYIYNSDQGRKSYILPVRGIGLWGPIWGYLALEEDLNTIAGVVFDHEKETPGLGAEITTEWFQSQFKGKKIMDEKGNFVSVAVKKGLKTSEVHAVQAISGATVTSTGVNDMIAIDVQLYRAFFDKLSDTAVKENNYND